MVILPNGASSFGFIFVVCADVAEKNKLEKTTVISPSTLSGSYWILLDLTRSYKKGKLISYITQRDLVQIKICKRETIQRVEIP